MVVEMLGATATMLYGLNIIMDPVHEDLEMEPDAPGITKVCLIVSSTTTWPPWHCRSRRASLQRLYIYVFSDLLFLLVPNDA